MIILHSVLALHTGLTMYGLRSVGSRHMHNLPFGFLTTTNEFSHSGTLTFALPNLLRIPCETILSSSCLNWSFRANGTLRGGFCTGTALCVNFICTGEQRRLDWVEGWVDTVYAHFISINLLCAQSMYTVYIHKFYIHKLWL